jgi:hypothetical protein
LDVDRDVDLIGDLIGKFSDLDIRTAPSSGTSLSSNSVLRIVSHSSSSPRLIGLFQLASGINS